MSEISEINEKFTNVYINNIDPSINSNDLKSICEKYGGRVISAIIIKERGVSLGYGFCNFVSHEEAVKAVSNMNNLFIMGKRLAVSRAASKGDRAKFLKSVHSPSGRPEENANVYVKNLDYGIDEEMLRTYFRPFGPIINVRIMRDDIGNSKGYGFVSYSKHADAAKAVKALNGTFIGKFTVHVDFYEANKNRKLLPRVSASAPASPYESFSKTRYSASNLVTPVQSKFPSPLVIPSKIEESSFYCGTPLNQDEVCDMDNTLPYDIKEKVNTEEEFTDSEDYTDSDDDNDNDEEREEGEEEEEEEENRLPRINTIQANKNAFLHIERKKKVVNDCTNNENTTTKPRVKLHIVRKSTFLADGKKNEAVKPESSMPKISQLIEKQSTFTNRENEIKVHGLRYINDEKDVIRLFYDFDCTGARPALNSRNVHTGDWYVTFASNKDAERALAMCNDECFVIRGCRIRAERALFGESSVPSIPSVRFTQAQKQLLSETFACGVRKDNSANNNNANFYIKPAYGFDTMYENDFYGFPSLMNNTGFYSGLF